MGELIQDLENAQVGDRTLDLRVWAALEGWKLVTQDDKVTVRAERYDGDTVEEWIIVGFDDYRDGLTVNYTFEDELPKFTTSLDSMKSWVDDNLSPIRTSVHDHIGGGSAEILIDHQNSFAGHHLGTTELAFCIATLSAAIVRTNPEAEVSDG